MNTYSFIILRFAIAASMLGHGLVRLPKLTAFSQWMVGSFKNALLPRALVTPFSYALPVAEFAVGLLLVLGLFTKPALLAGGVVMIILIVGTCLIENWEALPSQLIHVAFFALLLSYTQNNTFALDNLFKK